MKITCVEREYRFDLTGEHHRDQTRVVYLLPAKSIDFAQTLELDVRLFGFIDPPTKWIDNLLDEIDYSALAIPVHCWQLVGPTFQNSATF